MKKVLFLILTACSLVAHSQSTKNNGIIVTSQQSLDSKQYTMSAGKNVPYPSTAAFLSAITTTRRHVGEIAYIITGNKIYPYQFVNCIADTCLHIVGDTLMFSRVGDSLNISSGTSSKSVYAPLSTVPKITFGTGAPATTPAKIGDIYIDTSSGGKFYFAKGTSSSADWVITN